MAKRSLGSYSNATTFYDFGDFFRSFYGIESIDTIVKKGKNNEDITFGDIIASIFNNSEDIEFNAAINEFERLLANYEKDPTNYQPHLLLATKKLLAIFDEKILEMKSELSGLLRNNPTQGTSLQERAYYVYVDVAFDQTGQQLEKLQAHVLDVKKTIENEQVGNLRWRGHGMALQQQTGFDEETLQLLAAQNVPEYLANAIQMINTDKNIDFIAQVMSIAKMQSTENSKMFVGPLPADGSLSRSQYWQGRVGVPRAVDYLIRDQNLLNLETMFGHSYTQKEIFDSRLMGENQMGLLGNDIDFVLNGEQIGGSVKVGEIGNTILDHARTGTLGSLIYIFRHSEVMEQVLMGTRVRNNIKLTAGTRLDTLFNKDLTPRTIESSKYGLYETAEEQGVNEFGEAAAQAINNLGEGLMADWS